MAPRISLDRARRLALCAQGFADPRPRGRIDIRHFRRVLRRVGLVQLDAVNVVVRSHYLPFFSRLGPYDRERLDRWLWESRECFEYWGHEASVLTVDHHRLLRWRMDDGPRWDRMRRLEEEDPGYVEAVYREVATRGPLQVGDLADPGRRDPSRMWGWSKGKVALEALFARGRITTAFRPNFVRRYDLVERVVPAEHRRGGCSRREAQTALLLRAARSLGVATADDLADYYRLSMAEVGPLLDRLVTDRRLEAVEVEGWSRPGYLHPEATTPRRIEGAALLSPFDSLVWYRPRIERLWGFRYRLEIYVPADRRVHGYYVLPFLLDGDLVARVDLHAERRSGILRVRAAFLEEGRDPIRAAEALARELAETARWLGLDRLEIDDRGDLAPHLRRHVRPVAGTR